MPEIQGLKINQGINSIRIQPNLPTFDPKIVWLSSVTIKTRETNMDPQRGSKIKKFK
jgi:hypothetical protein